MKMKQKRTLVPVLLLSILAGLLVAGWFYIFTD
jgi:hypothetical protein